MGVLAAWRWGLRVAAVVYIKDHRPDAPIAKSRQSGEEKVPRQ